MIVKVGNQSFDSRQVPIALVLDDQDIMTVGTTTLKGMTEDGKMKPSLYMRWPQDIHPQVVLTWLSEAAPELDLRTLAPRLFSVGKPKEDQ